MKRRVKKAYPKTSKVIKHEEMDNSLLLPDRRGQYKTILSLKAKLVPH